MRTKEYLEARKEIINCIVLSPICLFVPLIIIFTEWLPGNGRYTMAEPVNIEWYDDGDSSAPDYKSGIMIPVK